MDFPFEYIERVFRYPKFELQEVKNADKKSIKRRNDHPYSEEEEIEKVVWKAKEEEVKMRKKVDELDEKWVLEKQKHDDESFTQTSSTRSSCFSLLDISPPETSLSDADLNDEKRVLRRYLTMQRCACTDSDCASRSTSDLSSSTSSSSTTSLTDDPPKPASKTKTKKRPKVGVVKTPPPESYPLVTSSEESVSSVDDALDVDGETEFLHRAIERRKRPRKDKEAKVDDWASSPVKADHKQSRVFPSQTLSPSGDALSSSVTSSTSQDVITSVDTATSSHEDDDDDESEEGFNLEKFVWDSDDLYDSTQTDTEFEREVEAVDKAIRVADEFQSKHKINMDSMEKKLNENFAMDIPRHISTATAKYKVLEEPKNRNDVNVVSKNFWLVQRLDNGHMLTAKIVSRKNSNMEYLAGELGNEIKILRELMPEVTLPTHIPRLLDVGCTKDFKFAIVDDLGVDLLSMVRTYESILNEATIFLIAYYTFNAIKELQNFGFIHTDIRPSAFSVTQNPFNVKICDLSRAVLSKKTGQLQTSTSEDDEDTNTVPNDAYTDAFSARIFHRHEGEEEFDFDEFVDFESWIYTMVFLFTKPKLAWTMNNEDQLKQKEAFFRDILRFPFAGCPLAVPICGELINTDRLTYQQFLEKMNLVFSVDVMKYADHERPILYRLEERHQLPRFGEKDMSKHWDQAHWNPADEPDTADVEPIDYELLKSLAEEKGASIAPTREEKTFLEARSPAPIGRKNKRGGRLPRRPPMRSPEGLMRETGRGRSIQERRKPVVPEKPKMDTEFPSVPDLPVRPKVLFSMPDDEFYGPNSDLSSNSQLSESVVSSWTTSSCSLKNWKKDDRFMWDLKSTDEDESDVDFRDGLNPTELQDFDTYQCLAEGKKKELDQDRSTESSISHVRTDDVEPLLDYLEKRAPGRKKILMDSAPGDRLQPLVHWKPKEKKERKERKERKTKKKTKKKKNKKH